MGIFDNSRHSLPTSILPTFIAATILVAGCDPSGDSPGVSLRVSSGTGSSVPLPYGCNGTAATSPYLRLMQPQVPPRSMARYWNEATLAAIRSDLPMPTVHARNLFHVSAALYDAWAAYDPQADGYYYRRRHVGAEAARELSMAFAAYRLLEARYVQAAFPERTPDALREQMRALGLNPCYVETTGTAPAAVGNAIAQTVLAATRDDGSNEAANYEDATGWQQSNPPLVLADAAITMDNPDLFQLLLLEEIITQNNIPQGDTLQTYIGPHWRDVRPFALRRPAAGVPYFSPPLLPPWYSGEMRDLVVEVIRREAALDAASPVRIDISPAGMGNSTLGTNDGQGHALNPATGSPYSPQPVLQADYGRVIAEFWADGPHSETPPGHWNLIANQVSDLLGPAPRPAGTGAPVDVLEWDVKLHFTLNGALHDAAIAAWELKRERLSARPVSLIRYRASLGQSSDPALPAYHPDGLPLVDGLIELVTEESSGPDQRHSHLKAYRGEVAVRGWLGERAQRDTEENVGWVRGRLWVPYQRATFVTPAFPGYVSGHSTFSRAGAEVLAAVTGSPWFPGGLFEYEIQAWSGLGFEPGPTEALRLQWATYFDAADQSGQSRIWGGIHIEPDDLEGRRIGHQAGVQAVSEASRWFAGDAVR